MKDQNKKQLFSVVTCAFCIIAGFAMHYSQSFFDSQKVTENPYAKEFIFKGPKVLGASDSKEDLNKEENEKSVTQNKEIKVNDLPEIDF